MKWEEEWNEEGGWQDKGRGFPFIYGKESFPTNSEPFFIRDSDLGGLNVQDQAEGEKGTKMSKGRSKWGV